YSKLEERHRGSREVQWAIRRADGAEALYYRATVVPTSDSVPRELSPDLTDPPVQQEPHATAAQTLLEQVRERSADVATYAQELVRRFVAQPPSEEVALLSEGLDTPEQRARFIAALLAIRKIPARVVHGIELGATQS